MLYTYAHNHDAHELFSKTVQCNTEGVTNLPPLKQNLDPRFRVPSVRKRQGNTFLSQQLTIRASEKVGVMLQ